MDLITEVVNARLPINTKCKVKIAMIEQKRIALKRKITMAMVTDFKVKEIDENVKARIINALLPIGDASERSAFAALLVNALAGGELYACWGPHDRGVHFFNTVNGKTIDVVGKDTPSMELKAVRSSDMLSGDRANDRYTDFVNRYMRNFMEEIK